MPERDDRGYPGVPQTYSTNVPVVVVTPPASEPSVTRGVTGLFVPIFLAVFIVMAIYFFFGAWQAMQALSEQRAITRETAEIDGYIDNLRQQNGVLCRNWRETPDPLNTPNLLASVTAARRAFDNQCTANRRFGEGTCTSAMPEGSPQLPTRNLSEFREALCAKYGGTAPRRR